MEQPPEPNSLNEPAGVAAKPRAGGKRRALRWVLMFYDGGVVAALAAEQERYFRCSRPLTLAGWKGRPIGRKVAQNVARLFSPLP